MIVETITGGNNTGWGVASHQAEVYEVDQAFRLLSFSGTSSFSHNSVGYRNCVGYKCKNYGGAIYAYDTVLTFNGTNNFVICKIDLIIFCMRDVFFLDKVAKKYNYMFT